MLQINQWHPAKQTTHLTTMWAQGDREQGTKLDHTALRWTLLALTDPNDLELFVKALHALLQSDSGTSFTRNYDRVAQTLFFGPDMLATNIVQLLHSAIPSDILEISPCRPPTARDARRDVPQHCLAPCPRVRRTHS